MTEKLKFVLERVENIVGKGENAGYQHFLLFPPCFPRCSFIGFLNVMIVWERFNSFTSYESLRSAQTDMNATFSLFLNFKFSACQRIILPRDSVSCLTKTVVTGL